MLGSLLRRVFGSANDRYVKSLFKTVHEINALEREVEELSDDALRARTDMLKQRLADGETLDDILPAAFATVREAAKRTIGQRHFDVQLIGGIVLHKGKIAEMRTGEGKTLVATLAVYLNALSGKGVHVVTVNDYLAKRDSEWMGRIYRFLGLKVGCIVHDLDDDARREQYAADITYGTNNEFGFDYLRDNMKFRIEEMVQRPFNYAIVDEVDSILIDEARTPLIISGQAEDSSETYVAVNNLIPMLKPEHYEKDEKQRTVTLTESGTLYMEKLLRDAGLLTSGAMYDAANVQLIHHIDQALRAHKMFQRDVDYIVKNNEVVIIDEFTGRMMEGRRYSDGLHQALEAKEHVRIQPENQTLASITFQNYFRLYPKLAGMTGTAMTEAAEFAEIYGLEVVDIPTNKPVIRLDHQDEIYRTEKEKLNAILALIQDCAARKQPVLVGTTSIEKSEQLASLLRERTKLSFNVLNARHHEQEAYIVAQAGMPGAITIATNMAGRGTDIQLGGNLDMRVEQELHDVVDPEERARRTESIRQEIEAGKEVALKAGGLYVIGTERHESRRIDNQLRGRSGRQGDPGASKFFLSLQDDLMRIFGSERMDKMLQTFGLQEGEAIVHPWVSKALQKAQEKVEARNFDIRKNLLKYDNVMNDQRKIIYDQRKDLMKTDSVTDTVADMCEETLASILDNLTPEKVSSEDWDVDALDEELDRVFNLKLPLRSWIGEEGVGTEELFDRILKAEQDFMTEKRRRFGDDLMNLLEKNITLQMLDQVWKEHLQTLEYMRHTIILRAYGQKDPLNEYKREAFLLFSDMLADMHERTVRFLTHVELAPPEEMIPERRQQKMTERHDEPVSAFGGQTASSSDEDDTLRQSPFRYGNADEIDPNDPSTWGKISRNAPCPCGSGKKYKHCHGALV